MTTAIVSEPKEYARGLVFIAGGRRFKKATVKVVLADHSVQDAPERLVASTTIEVDSYSRHVPFSLVFDWPRPRLRFDLSEIGMRAEVHVNGKLAFCTQFSHVVDLTGHGRQQIVIVAEPVKQ